MADLSPHQLAVVLIDKARQLYNKDPDLESVVESVYALDSTTIDLCLSLFPWAKFHQGKTAIKLHKLVVLESSVPTFIHISDGRLHYVKVLDMIPVMAGSIYIMDHGYVDFERLFALHNTGRKFVSWEKKNLQFYRKSSVPVDRKLGLPLANQAIRLTGHKTKRLYPQKLRCVHLIDKEHKQNIFLLFNITDCSTQLIAHYLRQCWQIELFFQWIKGHLRIKAVYGQNINAVKTQIWTEICTYLVIIILQKTNYINVKLLAPMQVLSVALLQHMPLKELFSEQSLPQFDPQYRNHLGLFDF